MSRLARPRRPARDGTTAAARRRRRFEERERRILDVARRLVVRDGYGALSMDGIAAEIEYSKGTVYQHFRSKEDVLVALAVATAQRRVELFERAAGFRGRSRERMAAVGESYGLFVRAHPEHFRIEQEMHTVAVRQHADAARYASLRALEDACKSTVSGIVADAVAEGDLVLPEGTSIDDVTFSLWSMTYGAFLLIALPLDLPARGFPDPEATLRRSWHALLDGWGWRPRHADWDYAATVARIHRELFPEGA